MSATLSAGFGNEAAGLQREGAINGKLMGRAITDLAKGLQSFASLVAGKINDGLKHGADAVKAHVQKLATLTTAPFALGVKEGFGQEEEGRRAKAHHGPPKPKGP